MKEEMEFILNNYIEFYNNQKSNKGKLLDTEMKDIITRRLPGQIQEQLNLDIEKYNVAGSYGMGYYTATPWISVFEKSITEGAQKGFYVVFLFQKDMSGFYLSLNQGTTYLENKFKGNKPRNKMQDVAGKLRNEIDIPYDSFTIKDIDLKSKTKNANNYSSANICSKYYSADELPDDEILLRDIATLLKPLNHIKKLIGLRNLDEVIDDLLFKEIIEDLKYQEDMLLSKPADTERKPKQLPTQSKYINRSSWNRNASIAKEAIALANYSCEIDNSHTTFKSFVSKENYVEAHHLIPINQQSDYKFSLDVPGNIVALCPNCHREIHHAENVNKEKLLKQLYNKRIKELEEFGLLINISELFGIYNL